MHAHTPAHTQRQHRHFQSCRTNRSSRKPARKPLQKDSSVPGPCCVQDRGSSVGFVKDGWFLITFGPGRLTGTKSLQLFAVMLNEEMGGPRKWRMQPRLHLRGCQGMGHRPAAGYGSSRSAGRSSSWELVQEVQSSPNPSISNAAGHREDERPALHDNPSPKPCPTCFVSRFPSGLRAAQ